MNASERSTTRFPSSTNSIPVSPMNDVFPHGSVSSMSRLCTLAHCEASLPGCVMRNDSDSMMPGDSSRMDSKGIGLICLDGVPEALRVSNASCVSEELDANRSERLRGVQQLVQRVPLADLLERVALRTHCALQLQRRQHHSQHVEVIVEKKQRLASSDVHREHALEDDRRVLSQLHRSRPTAVHVAQHQPREHLRRRQLEPDDERREF